jgi:DNA-binding FadR family transcriptional regulator
VEKIENGMFKKTTQQRLFQDLVSQIEQAILDGRLKTGDKLPPQRQLVDMFQTSRATLREALRVLELKGLIAMKLGVKGGAVVKRVNTEPVTESLALLMQHRQVSLQELAEFREGVEGQVAALAAERASTEEVGRLKQLLSKARVLLKGGVDSWEKFCFVDKQIHIAIAQASHNTVFRFVLRVVHDNIEPFYEAYPLKDTRTMQENFQDLQEIVRAIEKRKPTVVKTLMQSHVRRFNRHMLQQSGPGDTGNPSQQTDPASRPV